MKKALFFGMVAAAGMLLAASCTNDELNSVQSSDGEATISFTIGLDGQAQTRAISDGTSADKLVYAIYNSSGEIITTITTSEGTADTYGQYTKTSAFPEGSLEDKVTMTLAKGQSYTVLFWAQDADCSAYTTTDLKEVKVSYSGYNNDETRDAFYAAKTFKVTQSTSMEVVLKRPFAQLNVGVTADDWEAAVDSGVKVTESSITISEVANVINLYDGSVSQDDFDGEVTYNLYTIPADQKTGTGETEESLTVNEIAYKWISMSYILVNDEDTGAERITTSADFAFSPEVGEDITLSLTSIPVQRNYRTNIIGKILSGDIEFDIVINPNYETPDHDIEIWDGSSTTKPALSEDESTWIVSTAAEWVWLKNNGVSGKNITLDASLDFGGYEVKGLGFTGVFDGQGYSMSNMTILCGGSYYSNGLFQGDASGEVTIQNVTIDNVTAECSYSENGYVGAIFGDVQHNTTLNNVHVKNATLCGVQSVGGLVGLVAANVTLTVANCSVEGSTLSNYAVLDESGFVAGLVGRTASKSTVNITNSTVSNTTIDAYYTTKRSIDSISEIIATVDSSSGASSSSYTGTISTDDATTATDVTVTKKYLTSVSTTDALKSAISDSSVEQMQIVLSTDLSVEETLSIASDKEIDLNGNTLTVSEIDVAEGATLTISGGALYTSLRSDDNANINVDNVDMTVTTTNCAIELGNEDTRAGGGTLIVKNSAIDVTGVSDASGIIIQGNAENVVIENTTINHTYMGITQNGVVAGSKITLTNVDISGTKHGVYLSNNASGDANTLTVTGGSIHSEEATPIEVKKTTLKVDGATLSTNATWQGYFLYASGACSLGFGIVLAGHTDGVAYDTDACPYTLSNITYLRPNVVADGTYYTAETLFNAGVYNGYSQANTADRAYKSLDKITDDGAVE